MILRGHILEVIITVEVRISNLFLDYFSSTIIQHPLVTCLLNSVFRVFIHLLSIYDSISTTCCSVRFCLVNFFNWPTILIHCCLGLDCLLDKLSLTQISCINSHRIEITHLLPHLLHHFISMTKHISAEPRISEKRIIRKGIILKQAST